jgi:hypothetical protein
MQAGAELGMGLGPQHDLGRGCENNELLFPGRWVQGHAAGKKKSAGAPEHKSTGQSKMPTLIHTYSRSGALVFIPDLIVQISQRFPTTP